VEELNFSILVCKKCRKNIKIIICPRCRSYYSMTFATVENSKYMMTCKKCGRGFVVNFPVVREPIRTSRPAKRVVDKKDVDRDYGHSRGGARPPAGADLSDELENSPVFLDRGDLKNEEIAPGDGRVNNGIHYTGAMPGNFELKELFTIAFSSFSWPKMMMGIAGAVSYTHLRAHET